MAASDPLYLRKHIDRICTTLSINVRTIQSTYPSNVFGNHERTNNCQPQSSSKNEESRINQKTSARNCKSHMMTQTINTFSLFLFYCPSTTTPCLNSKKKMLCAEKWKVKSVNCVQHNKLGSHKHKIEDK